MPDSRKIPSRPRVALLLGDPSGIGPEIVVKLLAEAETSGTAFRVACGMVTARMPAAGATAL